MATAASGGEQVERTAPVLKPALHHVHIKTTNLDEMVAFYETVAGVEVNFRDQFSVFTSNDEAHHRLVFTTLPDVVADPDKVAHAGLHHTALEYGSLADLIATYERLRDVGIMPHMSKDHGMTMSIYYPDPDRNSVELQADNFADPSESREFMRTSAEFRANPFGVFFDPELIAAALAEGLTHEEIHQRAWAGGYQNEVTRSYYSLMPMDEGGVY